MAREIAVLGAGMVGVSIAYHLARRGHRVVLVDRKPPGHETSYGNAGLIQREAVSPHPFPRQLAEIWRVLPNRSIDIRYQSKAMLENMSALWTYWRYSAPQRLARIIPEYASLIMHCTAEHERMFEVAGAAELIHKDGWLELYRSAEIMDKRLPVADSHRERFGVTYQALDTAGVAAIEPDLVQPMAGAIHWTNTWSVSDPAALVGRYADAFKAAGGEIVQAAATRLDKTGAGWTLATDGAMIEAEQCVLATGPWSSEWLKRLNLQMPFFVMRGYHMHYGAQPGRQLRYALMDYERGYLLTPKRAGIRLTTGAELNSLAAPPRGGQLDAAEAAARELFPLAERLEDTPWKGARPCLGDMKPVIGAAPDRPGLWFAFGHGHQGFTLGPATGRLIGEMIDGESPYIDPLPFSPARFS
ncbi:MAG: FAD-binding oxidoreductase [Salinisphaera sp.]|jgi:D-amino-acid dehydrogenase|nr:FAD-binding oxidoreductase [Salinisphaera sp.]